MQTLFGKQEESFFNKLKAAVASTKSNLVAKIEDAVKGKKEIDFALLDDLEAILIGADIGVETSTEILEKIRAQVDRRQVDDASQLRSLIKAQLKQILDSTQGETSERTITGTQVTMVVGVNGVGKTTTIGKLANYYMQEEKKVLVCAADTFRAAAVEQLEVWGKRAGVEIIRQKSGADLPSYLMPSPQQGRAELTY